MPGPQSESERALWTAVGSARAPDGKSIGEAGLLLGVQAHQETCVVRCLDAGWPEPIRQRVEREIVAAVQEQFPQIRSVRVQWGKEQAAAASQPSPPEAPPGLDVRHVIAVGSGKGGVGKSTVSASLAYALAERGHRVGIMDADVYGPSIPHLLGIEAPPGVVDGRYQPPVVDGMPVMSMGFLIAPDQAVIWRGPMLHKAVRDFLYSVHWGSLDFLIVDLPPGTGDVVLSLSQQLPISGGVIVCTPQQVAILDARKALSMLRTVKIPCLGIVENMSYFVDPATGHRTEIFGHGGAEEWARSQGVPFLGAVPLDVAIRIHGDAGKTRDNLSRSEASRGPLLDIADRLLESLAQHSAAAAPTIEILE